MIIKTRLAPDSPLHRLSAPVPDSPFQTILKDLVNQWSLPTGDTYSLLWAGELVIDKESEWQLFCRLHPVQDDEIIELQLITASSLAKLL
jgi:hypothetical protein